MDHLFINLWKWNVTVRDLKIYEKKSDSLFFSAGKIFTDINVMPVFRGAYIINTIRIEKPAVEIDHYNNGGIIENVGDYTAWHNNTTGAYCWYNNDGAAAIASPYGALYNWYAVNSGKLCPAGWHVPSDVEWTKLTDFCDGALLAGGKLKESGTTHWNTPNTGADNSYGFTALPGGFRHSGTGEFQGMNTIGNWWSTKSGGTDALTWYMSCNLAVASSYTSLFDVGSSVRCIKDAAP